MRRLFYLNILLTFVSIIIFIMFLEIRVRVVSLVFPEFRCLAFFYLHDFREA